MYQYNVITVSSDTNAVRIERKNREVQEPYVRILPKIYEPVKPTMITQIIMSVLQLSYDKHFNQDN